MEGRGVGRPSSEVGVGMRVTGEGWGGDGLSDRCGSREQGDRGRPSCRALPRPPSTPDLWMLSSPLENWLPEGGASPHTRSWRAPGAQTQGLLRAGQTR